MRIIIVGDGKMGSTFAQRLSKAGHDVTIIDKRATALQHTIESLDIMAIEGNGTTLEIQREAGVEQADLLIVGVGASYQDAVETVGRIVDETYRETGGFDVKTYLREKEDRLRKKR